MKYRVLIVEDDPMVASINQQYVEMDSAFRVEKLCREGGEALAFLEERSVDLIILDYYTPGMSCLEFVKRLHGLEQVPAVIMVTSNNDASAVRELFSRGVLDYLVKPFQYQRFQQALGRFLAARQQLETAPESVRQRDIDQLLQNREQSPTPEALPKGLNQGTLRLVRDCFTRRRGERLTSEELAEELGLSRITVRRYVNFLAEKGEISSLIDYQTGGRPAIRYFCP